jgi:protease IV
MKDSIFFSAIRSFFIAMFSILGICIGFFALFILMYLVGGSVEGIPEINYVYTPEIIANSEGVRKDLASSGPVILKLNINGVIGTDLINRHTIEQQLIESRERDFKDNRVKALLVYIDSPGGTVTDADGIYRAIKTYKEKYKTPVFAYVDGLCASGGMYVAAACDKIYSNDSSIIGSIGVLSPSFLNFSQLMEKVGVQSLTLIAGKGKDDLNPLRPWKPGEQENIQSIINYYYDQFVNIVTSNRPQLDKAKLVKEYGANIYPAKIAKENGYIDESGFTLDETLKLLAKQISVEENAYQVVQMKDKNWFSGLFQNRFNLLKGNVTHTIELSPRLNPHLSNQYLYLYEG